jgi:hypothetical protein
MFTKLRAWELDQYDTVLYLDTDAYIMSDPSAFFKSSGFAAEPNLAGTGFNAGVMALKPSKEIFAAMMERAAGGLPTPMHGKTKAKVVDCTEQALLNDFFGSNFTALQIGRPDVVDFPWESQTPAVVHFITKRCPKPWTVSEMAASTMDSNDEVPDRCDHHFYMFWNTLNQRLNSNRNIGKALVLLGINEKLSAKSGSGEYAAEYEAEYESAGKKAAVFAAGNAEYESKSSDEDDDADYDEDDDADYDEDEDADYDEDDDADYDEDEDAD